MSATRTLRNTSWRVIEDEPIHVIANGTGGRSRVAPTVTLDENGNECNLDLQRNRPALIQIVNPPASTPSTPSFQTDPMGWRRAAGLVPTEDRRGYDDNSGLGELASEVPTDFDHLRDCKEAIDTTVYVTRDEVSYGYKKATVNKEMLFGTSVGMEMSFIAADSNISRAQDTICEAVRFIEKNYPFLEVHPDCGCIEFPANPTISMSSLATQWNMVHDAVEFWNAKVGALFGYKRLVKKFSYEMNGTLHCVGTGGLHIHFGYSHMHLQPDELALFKANCAIDGINRPYIHWLFQDWYKLNCNPYISEERFYRARNKTWTDKELMHEICPGRLMPIAIRDGSSKWRENYGTMEYRCFEMPETFEELVDLVMFVSHHQGRMLKLTLNGVSLASNFTKTYSYVSKTPEEMLYIYRGFFADINLDGDKYIERYFLQHYMERRRNGYLWRRNTV